MKIPTRAILASSISIAAAIALVACAPPAEEEADRTITIAVDELPTRFDPAQGEVSIGRTFLWQSVLSPLFWFDGNGDTIPALGTDFVVADDRMSVDITLRDDVTFPDGSHMDAEGVEAYWDHLLQAPGNVSKAQTDEFGVEFTATGEYTLKLTTVKPFFHPDYFYPDLIRQIFSTPVLSPSAIDDPEAAQTEPFGVGPYVISDQVPEVEVTLTRNPGYGDSSAYAYDTVVLKLLTDPIARLNALKSGQVDVAQVSVDQVAEAESSGFVVVPGEATYNALMIRNPVASTLEPLRDQRVRQAMALAFDREAIAENLDLGFGRVTSQAFVEGQAEYIEGGDERYGYDLEEARELMADAGYADGFDVTIPTEALQARFLPIIESSLADIGIRVTFAPQPDPGTFFVALMAGEYPLTLLAPGPFGTLLFLDEEFTGLGRIFDQNDEVDALLAVIRYGEPEASADASQELGEKLLDEVWYIPFSSAPFRFWASTDSVLVNTDPTVNTILRDIKPAE